MGKKIILSHRSAALLNVAIILLALLLVYRNSGAPYLSREQADTYALRRSLATEMEVLQTISVPSGSGNWSAEAEERLYLLRFEDTVGVMGTKEDQAGGSVFFGPSGYVQEYQNRDSMAIIPLYGIAQTEHAFSGLVVAVIPTNPEITRVEVVVADYASAHQPPGVFEAQLQYEGIFVATCHTAVGAIFMGVYDDLYAHNYLGAIGYDSEGNEIARSTSVWEDDYEN